MNPVFLPLHTGFLIFVWTNINEKVCVTVVSTAMETTNKKTMNASYQTVCTGKLILILQFKPKKILKYL